MLGGQHFHLVHLLVTQPTTLTILQTTQPIIPIQVQVVLVVVEIVEEVVHQVVVEIVEEEVLMALMAEVEILAEVVLMALMVEVEILMEEEAIPMAGVVIPMVAVIPMVEIVMVGLVLSLIHI